MPSYIIHFTTAAQDDIDNLYNYIAVELSLPITANKYKDAILDTIKSLVLYADTHPVSSRAYLQTLYGPLARTVHYKKMTIVYNIIGSEALIRRVIASSLIQ
jgi:plasmid stabilization system protein ParE